ncbi:MAG: PilZ domain-containing protein [Pyrinomonadaceae bacterium]
MNEDRRRAKRFRVNLPARWEGLMAQDEANICDISITGCMVLSGGEVTSGELVRLEIQFPNGLERDWRSEELRLINSDGRLLAQIEHGSRENSHSHRGFSPVIGDVPTFPQTVSTVSS